MNPETEHTLMETIDKMCQAVSFFETFPGNENSKLIQFSVEFCDNEGIAKDSVEVALSAKLDDTGKRTLFIEVAGILVKQITYDSEMLITTEAALGVSSAILESGGALHPAGWIMAIVTGGSFYVLGDVVATATSEAAGDNAMIAAANLWDLYKEVAKEPATRFKVEISNGESYYLDIGFSRDSSAPAPTNQAPLISFNGTNIDNVLNNEYILTKSYNEGLISQSFYDAFSQQISDYLVSDTFFNPNVIIDVPNIYDGFDGLSLDPIGAFYESVTPANDPALSIADKTFVLLDSTNNGLNVSALASKDTNADGKLTGTELSGLNMWRDLNENGFAESGEITTHYWMYVNHQNFKYERSVA